jgi:predicted NBD/HSP70 family sugar kinase
LVVDLRPTYATICVADVNGNFLSQESVPTLATADETAQNLATRLRQLMQKHSELLFEGVGISLPGRFDPVTQHVMFAPNLKWTDFDLKTPIEKVTGLRVEMENAANACVLAEIWFSPAETVRDLIVVAVAEGLGTGIFTNGQLVRGLHGMAGEFGHVPFEPNGLECTCGGRGCWEVYASNRAALRYYHEDSAAADGPTFRDLLTLAEAGDALAGKAIDRMAHAIGRGMRMVIAVVAPEEIVLAGEFTRLWRRMGPIIEAEVASATLVGKPPRIRPAAVEPSMARLRGAVALVLQKHFGSFSRVAVGESKGTRPRMARAQ